MTTSKKIKKIIDQFIEKRKDWENCNAPDNFYLSVCLFLINHGHVKINDYDEFVNSYDNLVVNNEFITVDNYQEYEEDFLIKRIGHNMNYIINELTRGYIYLLNYYKDGGYNRIECCIKLDSNYNAIDWR